ncbi:MAG: hypothetical protein JXA81_15705 [Sedimentisphaerales bacterium]|nr:hypothetical protein [Sedimentisphaerales bacterium]
MKLQPGAYARFDEGKIELEGELAANLLDLNLSQTARREDQALWVGIVPEELLRKTLCPEYFVRPSDLTIWISPSWKLPTVSNVIESEEFKKLIDPSWMKGWKNTKEKLIKNSAIPGIRFKRWDKKPGHWSVRINDNFRSHLRPVSQSPGTWEAVELGTHGDMGHG